MINSDLEQQIASLLACRPLPEMQLYELCERVGFDSLRPRKSYLLSPMWCQSMLQSLSAETFTGNSTICCSYLQLEGMYQPPTISFLAIM